MRCLGAMNVRLGFAALLLLAAGAGGCNAPGQPTLRMGALPFPGLGLYNVVDPDHLGQHHYWSPFQFMDGEVGRGIIYTQQAGFLDVAHIRDTADWTRYYARHVETALTERQPSLSVGGPDRSRIHMRFNYPAGWDALSAETRKPLIHELALRAGQEAAYAVSTWHELITWYDYSVLPFISERHSAFTYDDVMSHVVGLYVVERAWNDPDRDYGPAMEVALYDVLDELGAATPDETRQAVAATEGWWWTRGTGIKRHLDVGLADGVVEPMRIDGFVLVDAEANEDMIHIGLPQTDSGNFRLPRVADVTAPGLDFNGFLVLELESRLSLYRDDLRRHLPGHPERIVPERDIPILMQIVRREMRDEFGPFVDSVDEALALALPQGDSPE